METIFAVLFGVLIGMLVMNIINVYLADGDLYLNTLDPEYAACGFVFRKGANEIRKKKVIIVKVHTR